MKIQVRTYEVSFGEPPSSDVLPVVSAVELSEGLVVQVRKLTNDNLVNTATFLHETTTWEVSYQTDISTTHEITILVSENPIEYLSFRKV